MTTSTLNQALDRLVPDVLPAAVRRQLLVGAPQVRCRPPARGSLRLEEDAVPVGHDPVRAVPSVPPHLLLVGQVEAWTSLQRMFKTLYIPA